MTSKIRPTPRPAKDEWGVYDPEQAGLAAVLARLKAKDPKATPTPPATADAPPLPVPRPPRRDDQ